MAKLAMTVLEQVAAEVGVTIEEAQAIMEGVPSEGTPDQAVKAVRQGYRQGVESNRAAQATSEAQIDEERKARSTKRQSKKSVNEVKAARKGKTKEFTQKVKSQTAENLREEIGEDVDRLSNKRSTRAGKGLEKLHKSVTTRMEKSKTIGNLSEKPNYRIILRDISDADHRVLEDMGSGKLKGKRWPKGFVEKLEKKFWTSTAIREARDAAKPAAVGAQTSPFPMKGRGFELPKGTPGPEAQAELDGFLKRARSAGVPKEVLAKVENKGLRGIIDKGVAVIKGGGVLGNALRFGGAAAGPLLAYHHGTGSGARARDVAKERLAQGQYFSSSEHFMEMYKAEMARQRRQDNLAADPELSTQVLAALSGPPPSRGNLTDTEIMLGRSTPQAQTGGRSDVEAQLQQLLGGG